MLFVEMVLKYRNTIIYRLSNTFDESIPKIDKIKSKFGDGKLK